MRIIQKPAVDGLPENRVVVFFGKIDKQTFFIIHRPKKNWDYSSFRVCIGPAYNIQETEMTEIMKYPSGSITIGTVAGRFFFPGRRQKDLLPLLNGYPIYLF